MRKARLTFSLPRKAARVVEGSLKPETGREIPRTRFRIWTDEKGLSLVVEAEDTSALRAALNSYCRWIEVAEKTLTLI